MSRRCLVLGAAVMLATLVALRQSASAQANTPPRVFSADPKTLTEVKARILAGDKSFDDALKTLRKDADKSVQVGTFTVVNKPQTPTSGDKHDYMSLAPYWWPDPSKPDGLPYIRKDGQVNPEREAYDLDKLDQVTKHANNLAFAYYFTGDEAYAQKAAELIRVFFLDDATKMNPNLRYAQLVRGREHELRASGVIESDRLRRVVDADGLLAGSKSWSESDHEKLVAWMKEYLNFLLTSDMGVKESQAPNNHGTWYTAQAATFALFVGDEAKAKELVEGAKDRLAHQIEPDGSQPEELARTKAFDYSRFNILGYMQIASIGERVGVDLWNYRTDDGRSLRVAIDWLAPYGTGEKKWEYDQITDPKISDMFLILRRAAIEYREPKYEEMALKVPGADAESSRLNLLYPKPKF